MDELIYAMMTEQPAIQNLEFLRQLIAEARAQEPGLDAERLRMIYGTGMGTDRPEDV
jgi:hypothetical protein